MWVQTVYYLIVIVNDECSILAQFAESVKEAG